MDMHIDEGKVYTEKSISLLGLFSFITSINPEPASFDFYHLLFSSAYVQTR